MGQSMYKTDLVKRVAKDIRLTQRVVSGVLNASHRLSEQTLQEGRRVTFPGFGTFYSTKRKEGKVRHIHTGQLVPFPARRIAAFRVGDVLKRAVRGRRRREPRQSAAGKPRK